MPYPGVPEHLTEKMERCVEDVMADGKSKSRAIAICKSQIAPEKRALSLTERVDAIKRGWQELFESVEPTKSFAIPQISKVFDDHVLFRAGRTFYSVKFTWPSSTLGTLEFNFDTLKEVEATYPPVRSMCFPNPIRSVGNDVYETYAVRFTGPDQRDLHGTYFDQHTNYYLDWFRERPWLYHHGLRPKELVDLKAQRVGTWTDAGIDEKGVFVRGELDRRHQYLKEIKELLDEEVLFPSSGTLGYLMKVAPDGHVEDWPIVEISSTVAPSDYLSGPISERAMRAISRLNDSGRFTMGITDDLREVLSTLQDTVRGTDSEEGAVEASDEEESLEEAPEVEGSEENLEGGEAEEQDSDEEGAEEEGTWDARAAHEELTQQVRSIVEKMDQVLAEHDEQIRAVADVAEKLAEDKITSVRSAMTDEDWSEGLFVATRGNQSPKLSEEEEQEVRSDNEDTGDGTGGVFEATRVA